MRRVACAVVLAFLFSLCLGLHAHGEPGLPAQSEGGIFVRGDVSWSRKLEISDAIASLSFLSGKRSPYSLLGERVLPCDAISPFFR